VFYFVVKFLSTWISFWSGIPGGIFAPALSVGAGLGYDVALLTSSTTAESAIVALGMAGFLAAITQAPITSFIIVMEMTDGHSMVLSLMATALVSSMLSRIISEPLYPALADLQVSRVQTLSNPPSH
jgi:H+/Cl- antiporter ClcA